MLNLDTHILVHAMDGSLTPRERALLTFDQWAISAMVLWEIDMLAERGRIALSLDSLELRRALRRIHVVPVDAQICRSRRMLDIRSDPADEIIAATSIATKLPLLTRDKLLKRSKVVPLAPARPPAQA